MTDFVDPSLAEEKANKVYSLKQIGTAAFLGGPIAGLWLIADNFKLLGERGKASRAWLTAWLGSTALIIGCFFLPENFPSAAIAAPIAFSLHRYAKDTQGKKIDEAMAAGAVKQSNWRVAALAIASLVALLVMAFAFAFAKELVYPSPDIPGTTG